MEHIRSRAKELEESENKRGAEILQPIASGNCTNRTADDVAGLTNIRQIIDSGSVAKGKALGTLSVIYVIYTLLGGSFIYYTEYDWTYIDAVYCTFITLSTIGFGDLIPGKGKFKAYWAVKTLTYFVFTYVGLIIFSACFALSLDKIRYVAGKVRRKFCRTSGCSFCSKGKSVSTGDCEN
ncbi:potassium channel subfamily K member 13-like [Ptychodera flava]|uniref:potassium channel subfamily K member 13-like n=1 Tax=Ptychodera flava TaxID=63121 RepID=UPI00396A020A